ncbi:MAG: tetratricopeptide repeat protein [Cypionkella sp.]|nr:tetratricopeptide repeat protein [Cypionkella sp.]
MASGIMRPLRPWLVAAALCLSALPVVAQEAGAEPDPALSDVADAGAYLAARAALSEHSYRDAAFWYDRALGMERDNPFLLEGLVLSLMGKGDFAAAAEAAEQLLATGGRSQAGAIALLVADAREGAFDVLLEARPERAIGNLMDQLVLAWSEFGMGRMADAVARFDAIIANGALKPFGLYHKALALAAVGDFQSADDILSGRAEGPLVVNRRGVIAHAQILSQLERHGEALDLLERSFGTEAEPQLDQIRRDLAAGAPLPFTIVPDAQAGMAEVLFSLAVALNGEAEDAYTLLYALAAVELNPAHVEAVLLSAGLLERLDQPALAADVYARIAPDNPAYYTAELGRISTLLAQEQQEEGLDALEALAGRYPDLGAVHTTMGDALRRAERFEEAAAAYTRAIDLIAAPEQRHWGLFYARAVAFERAKLWEQAEPDFRRALELNPDQAQVLNYLGYSFVDRNENLDEALALIKRAVELQPDAGYIIDSLAWAYFRLGRYEEALEPMERASLLEPVDPVVTDHLGDVYWAVGREREARFQWRRALSFEPEEAEAERIRRKLEVGLDEVLREEGAPPLHSVPNAN